MSKTAAHAKHANKNALTRSNARLVERQNSLGAHVCIQRQASGLGVQPHAPSLVREVMNSPGQPLDSETRSLMEPRFGYDFSGVRVHSDGAAAESARAVSANAYTAGNHVAFAPGRYAPESTSGRQLIAHELTHVVQQSSGEVSGTLVGNDLYVSSPSDSYERIAHAQSGNFGVRTGDIAESRRGGNPVQRRTNAVHIQRDSLGLSTGKSDEGANAVNQASALGAWSALGSAVGGLVSAMEAHRQANLAQLQAEAAVDPPTAPPLVGGVTSQHVELPQVKGIHTADWRDVAPTETAHTITAEGLTGESDLIAKEKTPIKKGSITTKSDVRQPRTTETASLTERATLRKADTPDKEKPFTILRLRQGKDNVATFGLTLRHSDPDINGGATEDGDIVGYQGGSAYPNASVAFRTSPGAPEGDGTATVRLLFNGTNVPAREKPPDVGFFGAGFFGGSRFGSDPKYHIQRFSGSFKFTGKGEAKVDPHNVHVTPGAGMTGDGSADNPLLTVDFDGQGGVAGAAGLKSSSKAGSAKAGGGTPVPPGDSGSSTSGGGNR